ncbi:hypothetical protein MBLNU457_4817t1 [Dothideomycetes sp. NU457]
MASIDQARSGSNMADDPFISTPPHAHPPPLRYASFDHDKFSMQTSSSPTQARRALEAHMKETDRRIQDASRLGTSLLQQRKELAARLKELEAQKNSSEITPELQKKLAELEREYTEVGRETARAFLPKSSMAPATNDQLQSPAVFSGDSRASPSKVTAPSRKQRNQPASRVHDIEFATEISTSLLAQVRSLQAALVEKDDALRQTTSDKSQLEMDYAHIRQRMRQFDDNEQKYKDENWNLETQLQEITALHKDATDREQRLHQTLKSSQSDREGTLRELEDLKATHGKLYDDHANIKRQHESDLHYLRRDIDAHEHERDQLQKKIEELMSQNTELARAVALRWNEGNDQAERSAGSGDDDLAADRDPMDYSPPPSPTKGGRQGGLETETLKSSLQHAHRMIQNLKNNIHREKTEKIELKRMLQDARDEVESRRTDGGNGTMKKRRSEQEPKQKKPLSQIGAARMSKEEIFMEDDPEWEDHDGESPIRRSTNSAAYARNDGVDMPGAYLITPMEESTDAFETANENETDAFQTGNEEFDEDSGEATETEAGVNRRDTVTQRMAPLNNRRAGDRSSFLSTASTSADEDENNSLPIQGELPRYRMRASRLIRRGARPADIVEVNSSANNSPAISHFSSDRGTPVPVGQSLGDELDGLSDEETEMEGTPSRSGVDSDRFTPASVRSRDVSGATPATTRSFVESKPDMVDSGMMTEPWEPEQKESKSVLAAASGAVGGLFAGITGSAIAGHADKKDEKAESEASEKSIRPVEQKHQLPEKQDLPLPVPVTVPAQQISSIINQETEPVAPAPVERAVPQHSSIVSQHTEPIVAPSAPPPAVPQQSAIVSQDTEPTAASPVAVPAVPQHSAIVSQQTEPVVPSPSAMSAAAQHITPESPVLPLAFQQLGIVSQHIAPESPARPRALEQSDIVAQHTAPESPARPRPFEQSGIMAQQFTPESPARPREPEQSGILSQHTEPQTPQRGLPSQRSTIKSQHTTPVSPQFADFELTPLQSRPAVSLSSIVSQNVEPLQINKSAKSVEPTEFKEVNASIFPPRGSSRRPDQDPAAVIRDVGDDLPMLIFGDHFDDGALTPRDLKNENKRPFTEVSNNVQRAGPDAVASKKPSLARSQTSDEGTQTAVSSQQIDSMLKGKGKESGITFAEATAAGAVAGAALGATALGSPQKQIANTSSPRRSSEPSTTRADAGYTGKRPGSAGSMRRNMPPPLPPLPADYTERIGAAGGKTPGGSMGPPLMPASAYKSKQQSASVRSRTPSISKGSQAVRHSNSLRPVAGASQVGSPVSRQTSVSSFASEVDQRFNPAGAFMYPSDVSPSTDPRMIQAITQTMIGEYLWKYTRKTGSEKVSDNRHRRFFWVHPYTRTLYWSEQDPSTAGTKQLKGKSVAIEAVRVITDDNVSPPGLHRKSLVVVTPGREIVFTAPTAQRHETWFNALSYLLMRTTAERDADIHDMTEDEVAEFNPGQGRASGTHSRNTTHSRSASRGRVSLSTYNSRVTSRNNSPRRPHPIETPTLTSRHDAPTPQIASPAPNTPLRSPSKLDTDRTTTMSGRLSSLSGFFRPGSVRKRSVADRGTVSESTYRTAQRGTGGGLGIHNAPQDPAAIYDASIADSSEDLRAVIERQERDSGRLENVRACCDGKHDVGSLSHAPRHGGVGTGSLSGSLMGRHGHQGHSHAHPPIAEPMSTSSRPRRGE